MVKTQEEVVKETIDFYSEDTSRRAKSLFGGCAYLTDDGKMCAVGRCFNEEGLELYGKHSHYVSGYMLRYLKSEYSVDDLSFWSDVQELHDNDNHWDENGLTKEGLDFVNKKFGHIL